MVRIRRLAETPTNSTPQAIAPHDAFDPLAAHSNAIAAKAAMDPRTSIGRTALLVDPADLETELAV